MNVAALTPPRRLRHAWPALAAIILIFITRLLLTVRTFSQTVDEPYHIGAAVAIYEAHAHILGVEQPPLPRLVCGLPLVLIGAELPEYRGKTAARKGDPAYAAGAQILFARDAAWYWRVLTVGRCAMLVFPAAALLYVFLLGRYLVDDRAGLAAALLLSLDATLLGHGLWICTDGPAAAGFLAVIYHSLRWVNAPSTGRAAAAGVAAGLGLACKFSVVIAFPALLLILTAHTLTRRKRPPAGRVAAQLGLIALTAFIALWATYLFHIGRLGDSDTLASAPQWGRLPAFVKETPIPMPALLLGLGRLQAHSVMGHSTYFLGHLLPRGPLAYFPVLIAAKTPVALLAALIVGVLMAFERKTRSPLLLLGVLIPASAFLLVSMVGTIQIGIRHVLPAIALLYLLAGAVLTRSRVRVAMLAVVAVAAAAETACRHPDYLSFYNVAVGGPAAGPRIALDSNTDWGQDVARLAAEAQAGRLGRLVAIYPLGDRQAPLFRTLGLDERLLNPASPPPPGSLVAVSRTRRAFDPDAFAFLSGLPESGHVGGGFAIYRLRE